MSTFGQKVKHELEDLMPVTVLFFATFQMLALTDALILKQYGISVSLFILLLGFCAFRELVGTLGKKRISALFFPAPTSVPCIPNHPTERNQP